MKIFLAKLPTTEAHILISPVLKMLSKKYFVLSSGAGSMLNAFMINHVYWFSLNKHINKYKGKTINGRKET